MMDQGLSISFNNASAEQFKYFYTSNGFAFQIKLLHKSSKTMKRKYVERTMFKII